MWRSHPLAWERPSGGFRSTVVGCIGLGLLDDFDVAANGGWFAVGIEYGGVDAEGALSSFR
jgi:hypothetical protein